ncbi:MAG: hypothetical protein AB1324_03585 [Candidatus Micrarchaeota archaeon]
MVFEDWIDDESKLRIVNIWRRMNESDKAHFINQVALALSVWGSDVRGKHMVVEVLRRMTNNGTSTLADFGLYVEKIIGGEQASGMEDKVRRAAMIIEGYRIKNALPSEPHKELF